MYGRIFRSPQARADLLEIEAFIRGDSEAAASRFFDAAEKWYKAALQKKPDDMPTLDGLCAALLSKGDAKGAEEQINKLAKIDPTAVCTDCELASLAIPKSRISAKSLSA